jgi:HlyD family secretion protein
MRRKLWLVLGALGIVGLLVYAFLPSPVDADVALVERGRLVVTVDREGKTRVKERYVVSTPLAGRLQRIELHPGDRVEEGKTVLAVIEPGDPSLLDPRALTEAEARVKAAEEVSKLAAVNLKQARAELERSKRLLGGGISPEEFERAEHRERAASFSARIADYELELAKAALVRSRPRSPGDAENWQFHIRSPITGCVLEVFQENARTVLPGTDLLKLGDPSGLECVIDVLSTDGVSIRQALATLPQVKVLLEHWGGGAPLRGRVRLVEPAAFLKVSALGVEEQRVNVVVDFTDSPEKWQALGDSYRVEARIITWEGENVLKVPAGALFQHGEGWAVFRVSKGRAFLHPVRIGRSNGLESEVLDGLDENDQVVVYPSDRIQDGVAVRARQERPSQPSLTRFP